MQASLNSFECVVILHFVIFFGFLFLERYFVKVKYNLIFQTFLKCSPFPKDKSNYKQKDQICCYCNYHLKQDCQDNVENINAEKHAIQA